MNITQDLIHLVAPNAAAIANGQKISKHNDFSGLTKSEDETLIWGECAGSGKTPYRTSIDFLDSEKPIFRCSCPSRQIPCKHALGLMFDWLADKSFSTAPIPEEIQTKRDRKAKRENQNEEAGPRPKKSNAAAQTKKLKKQLVGLDMADQMVQELMKAGLHTLSGTAVKTYENLAKELGNYYLPGPQLLILRLVQQMQSLQANPEGEAAYYQNASAILIQLASTIKKARGNLAQKLEHGDTTPDDSVLFEALGGVWKLEDLKKIGSYRQDVRLVQLSFDVSFDEARREYIDRGYWIDVDSGEVSQTLSYRPIKALKYVKEEDTNFSLVTVPEVYYYPGDLNRRIRWDACSLSPLTQDVIAQVLEKAQPDIATAVKAFKNQAKNTLSTKYAAMLLPYSQIGILNEQIVLQDLAGKRIVLKDPPGEDARSTVVPLSMLPRAADAGAIFGILFYHEQDRRIYMQPLSLISSTEIMRLRY